MTAFITVITHGYVYDYGCKAATRAVLTLITAKPSRVRARRTGDTSINNTSRARIRLSVIIRKISNNLAFKRNHNRKKFAFAVINVLFGGKNGV